MAKRLLTELQMIKSEHYTTSKSELVTILFIFNSAILLILLMTVQVQIQLKNNHRRFVKCVKKTDIRARNLLFIVNNINNLYYNL